MTIEIVNKNGESTGRSISINEELLKKPNEHAVYLAVKQFLANNRQGTHKSKERNEVAGSTRKLHKQKGTGGARKGDIKNPLYHGGGRIFGPRPRDYSQDLNKKVKKEARRSAFASKLLGNKVIILDQLEMNEPKTSEMVLLLKNLNVDSKPLLVTESINKNIYLSGRNIPKVKVSFIDELNTYDIMNANKIIILENAVEKIVSSLS